jgi:hypothetical protein
MRFYMRITPEDIFAAVIIAGVVIVYGGRWLGRAIGDIHRRMKR